MAMQSPWLWGLFLGGILTGCSRSPEQPPGTGAKECAQTFYEALIQQEWPKAYAALDPETQQGCDSEQFSQLAQSYRSGLGFEPETVQVRACDERGIEATAHIVLTGRAATKGHRFKDAVTLRRGEDGWRVVVAPNFGRSTRR